MSKVSLSFGDKVALFQSRTNASGFVSSTNNSQFPVAVTSLSAGQKVPSNFENSIFQILSGDGDIKNCLSFNRGQPVLYGQPIRLLHVKTFSLMCCNKKTKAYKEKANFRVSFETVSDDAKGNRWRIMPKYKVRGEGERVCGDDEVIFQLHGYQFFLHTCPIPMESEGEIIRILYELNVTAVQESSGIGYNLHAYDVSRTVATKANRFISGGDCVTLFHKQETGPLACGRKPSGEPYVHIEPSAMDWSTSNMKSAVTSNALFLTEFEDTLRGGVMVIGKTKLYRLKSLATGEYLCVTERPSTEDVETASNTTPQAEMALDTSMMSPTNTETVGSVLESMTLSLTSDPANPGTLFSMFQTTDDPETKLKSGTRVLVQCPNVGIHGVWLTAGRTVTNTRASVTKLASPQKEIALCTLPLQKDAFEIRVVSKETYQQLYFVLNLLPSLHNYADAFTKGTLPTEQVLHTAKDSLTQLIRYCSLSNELNPYERDGIPIKDNQRMLVDQHVPELCVHVIRSTFSSSLMTPENLSQAGIIPKSDGIRYSDIKDVGRLCFRLIRLCAKWNIMGGVQLFDSLKVLMVYTNYGLGVLHCMQGICEDNDQVVDTPDDTSLVEYGIEQCLAHEFSPRFLQFLDTLCVSKGRSILCNQNRVIERLSKKAADLFLKVNLDGGVVNIVSPINPKTNTRLPFIEPFLVFISPDDVVVEKGADLRDNITSLTKHSLQEYFVQQLNLLAGISHGKNENGIKLTHEIISVEALVTMITTLNDTTIKTSPDLYVAAIRLLHFAHVNIDPFKALEIDVIVKVWGHSGGDVMHRQEPVPTTLKPLINFFITFVEQHPSLSYKSNNLNLVTQQILSVLHTMVSFQWLEATEIVRLFSASVQMVSAENDEIPDLSVVFDRYAYTEKSHVLMRVKEQAVDILTLIFDVYCQDTVHDFFNAFEKSAPAPHLSQIFDVDKSTKIHEKSKEMVTEQSQNAFMSGLSSMKNLGGNMIGGVASLTKGLVGKIGIPMGEKKANPYQYLINLHEALMEAILFKYDPLSTKSIQVLLKFFNYPAEVGKCLKRVQLLSNDRSIQMFKSGYVLFEKLRGFGSQKINVTRALDMVDILSSLCDKLTEDTDLFEKQTMFMNLGLPSLVINIIKHTGYRNLPKQKPIRALLEMCYRLLTQLCSNNVEISAVVFSNNELFSQHLEYDVGVIELLVVILDESIELCNLVPESLLKQVITIMVERDCFPLYVLFLRKIIWIDDKPVPRIQEMLWKIIVEKHMGAETTQGRLLQIHDTWTRERGMSHRASLLAQKDYENPDGALSFHLQWLSLLHAIVKGKDVKVKREFSSISFQSSGVAEVLEVITNRTLPIFFRAPYVRIFHEVFIDDKANQSNIMEEPELLVLLVHTFTEDVKDVLKVLRKTGPSPLVELNRILEDVQREAQMNDSTDMETRISYITLIIPSLIRHLLSNIVPSNEDLEVNFKRHIFAELTGLAEAFLEWIEIDKLNAVEYGTCFAIPLVSPTRRISGKRNIDIIFPSERSTVNENDACVYRLTPQERKNIKNMFVELTQRGIGSEPSPPGILSTATLEDAVTKLQKDLNLVPPKRTLQTSKQANSEEGKIFSSWSNFIKTHQENVFVVESNRYAALALNILKSGRHAERVLRAIVALLRSSDMSDEVRKELFVLFERLFDVEDAQRQNDLWILHPDELPPAVEDSEGAYKLLIHKTHEERQCIINRISELAAILVEFTGRTDHVAQAAMKLGIAFLQGGNLDVQTSVYNYCMEKSDEDFFQTNRNRLSYFQTMMKEKKQSIKRILGSKEQAMGPLPDDIVQKIRSALDFDTVVRNLRFLQLLVEGHNLLLQDYLRVQRDNQVSVDVVEACAALLISVLRARVDRISLDVCMQNIATLTEFVQGPCVGNQQRLINSNIGECINLALRSEWADLTPQQNLDFKEATVVLLLSLIEGKITIPLAVELIQSLSLESLAKVMDQSHERWLKDHDTGGMMLMKGVSAGMNIVKGLIDPTGGKNEDDGIDLGCYTFIYFKAMVDIVGRTPGMNPDEYWAHIVDRDGKSVKDTLRAHASYKFFNTLVGSIEINRNASIEKVYFRVPEAAKMNLRKSARDDLLKDVDRDSLSTKLNDFFEKAQDLIFEIKFFEELSKTRGLAVIHEYYPYFDNVSILLSIVVNLFLLFAVSSNDYYTNSQEIPGNRVFEFYYVLGYIIVSVQGCLTLHFLFGSLKIHVEYSWRSWEESLRDDAVKESKANMALDPPIFMDNARNKLMLPEFIARTLYFIVSYWPFWQRVLFMVASVLGTEVHPFFFSLQLLQCIQKSPQLQNVVLAVTKNGKNLLLTLMLMLIFVYMFSLLAYYEFSESIHNGDLGDGFQCDTLLKCFMLMSTYGLRAGGGIGDFISPPKWSSTQLAGRILFDMLFFALLIIIFMNIVFGIIIDTFAELREDRQSMEDDQTGTCFMCGIDKATLDRQAAASGGFDSHVDYDHNMWQYVYYMYFLTMQDVEELNGQEYYSYQMMQRRDITFFPIGKALVLREDLEESGEESHTKEQDELSSTMISSMHGRFDELKALIEKFPVSVTSPLTKPLEGSVKGGTVHLNV